jgi:hypothetical protein
MKLQADTLESSSTLIFYKSEQSLYTQSEWQDSVVIKSTESEIN